MARPYGSLARVFRTDECMAQGWQRQITERVVNGIERTGAAFAEGLIGEGVEKTVVKIGPAD